MTKYAIAYAGLWDNILHIKFIEAEHSIEALLSVIDTGHGIDYDPNLSLDGHLQLFFDQDTLANVTEIGTDV